MNQTAAADDGSQTFDNADAYRISTAQEITIPESGTYRIDLRYEDDVNTSLLPNSETEENVIAPQAFITTSSSENVYLEPDVNDDHLLTLTIDLETGVYPIQIKYIYGRSYTIETSLVSAAGD